VKFVTYASADVPSRVGRLDGGTVLDVGFDGDMVAFIEAGAPLRDERAVPGARLLAPLVPRSFRDFLAFEGHLINAYRNLGREVPAEWYEVPVYYRSMGTTVTGPDTVLPWPSYSRQLDHELELAAVIGRPCRDVAAADALDCVFGFTIWNDMSARDVQRRELPVGMGPAKAKEWDGSNVLGPCIVTPDEIDLATLELEVRVNGERWGGDRVSAMHHSFGDLIAYAAQDQTLLPGEVLGSGTATGGSGLEMDRWIQPGDVIEMEAGPIGVLRNTVGTRSARPPQAAPIPERKDN
jgi:2-keto-4-pentenoate hydratase/2-oxohepta-3-ene-1,7-dioic acid hydratase in catechol pathway